MNDSAKGSAESASGVPRPAAGKAACSLFTKRRPMTTRLRNRSTVDQCNKHDSASVADSMLESLSIFPLPVL